MDPGNELHHDAMQPHFHVKDSAFMTPQCHGLWDNKEVEMPDFFKKMKRKVESTRMTEDKTSSKEQPQCRLKFLPLQASTTSIFFRRKTGEPPETDGEYSEKAQDILFGSIYLSFCCFCSPLLVMHLINFPISFISYWRGNTQKEAWQKEATTKV